MRSLRWGGELLQEMAQHEGLSAELRQRAAQLIPGYPTPGDLLKLAQSNAKTMSAPWSDAITTASAMFDHLTLHGQGDETLRRKLLFTCRHFPDRGFRQLWDEHMPGFAIQDWLMPEDV